MVSGLVAAAWARSSGSVEDRSGASVTVVSFRGWLTLVEMEAGVSLP
jgi:hypothetical protein